MSVAEYPGDPAHPNHLAWITSLGRVTYASQALAGIAVDVLRTHFDVDFWDLLPDSLGQLVARLERLDKVNVAVPGLSAWLIELSAALVVRNDLVHALPVRDGLHRRTAKDPKRVVNFFTIAALDDAATVLTNARRSGSVLLYHDGGTAVARLSASPGGYPSRDA